MCGIPEESSPVCPCVLSAYSPRVIGGIGSQLAFLPWLPDVPSSCRLDGSCMCTFPQALDSAHRDVEVNLGARPGSNHLSITQEPQRAIAESLPPLFSDGKGEETHPGPGLFLSF